MKTDPLTYEAVPSKEPVKADADTPPVPKKVAKPFDPVINNLSMPAPSDMNTLLLAEAISVDPVYPPSITLLAPRMHLPALYPTAVFRVDALAKTKEYAPIAVFLFPVVFKFNA